VVFSVTFSGVLHCSPQGPAVRSELPRTAGSQYPRQNKQVKYVGNIVPAIFMMRNPKPGPQILEYQLTTEDQAATINAAPAMFHKVSADR
jgi:hypothetical protein